MGTMSASGAAPLPRLGEVFFDVRGSSRSMRLSWYADTGISVFSIWQGGTCTGTFRLPREELFRLIEALRRGMPGADQRDYRGMSYYSRQLSGVPTDPRLTALPGYADARNGDFTGPVTGDFRALRPDDQASPMMLGSASPRAALPAGSYRDQPRYSDQAQYAEPGYTERGYGARNGYDDQGYGAPAEHGYQGYGYGEQGYADRGDQSPTPPSGSYAAPAYPDVTAQGYEERGYPQHRYQDQGYRGRGRHEQGGYPDQGYGRYGHGEQPKHAQAEQARGSYPGPDAAAGYQHQRGPAEQGYSDAGGQAYADQGYDAYRYAEQDYRGQGYQNPDEAESAYQEPEYGSYAGGDAAGNGYQAGYGSGAYNGTGYGSAGYGAGRYGAPGYDSGGYPNGGYDGANYEGAHYDGAPHDSAQYDGAQYDGAQYDGAQYDGAQYDGAQYDGAHYDGGYDRRGYEGAGYDDGSGRIGGYRPMPGGRGSRDRVPYQDPDITPSQPSSTFPYDGGPPPGREYRRRRARY